MASAFATDHPQNNHVYNLILKGQVLILKVMWFYDQDFGATASDPMERG
jgi:hypothetical protein